MVTTVAYDELSEVRIHRAVTGGARWNSNFMQPPKGTRLPQAFLVENTPHRLLRTHYHDVDQFQVIVSGNGTLGKHRVQPYSIHFARAHTPYGPITAGEEGIAWLTLRARRDAEGAQFLPEKRDQLERVQGRNPWQSSQDPTFASSGEDAVLRPVTGLEDERGLAAYSLELKPNARMQAPSPAGTGGQYVVVVRGSLMRDGKALKALTLAYVSPDESALDLMAGADGLAALVLNFPRHDEPILTTHAVRQSMLKRWRCTLCAFVYDESKGLPEDGIAAGTRWEDVPDTWSCSDCGASKAEFDMVEDH